LKTVYLGTSEFAGEVLRRLAASVHRPLLVATPPDRPKGRGRRMQSPPAAEVAAELGIELLQTAAVNDEESLQRIRALRPEAIIVCAFGQLIREPLLSEWPLLNIHPSLLPHWRGAAPIERAIMAGEERTGVCVMQLTEGLDAGPVALREEVPIGSEDDFAALSAKLASLGGDLLVRALDLLAESRLEFVEQDEEAATYAEKITAEERRLDPARPAAELASTVRALTPHVGAYLEMSGGERLGVRRARAVDVGVKTGEVKAEWGALLLGCGRGALRLELVQPAGGKAMAADAYLRGHSLPKL
jgi:methionyl-tRNA formyltransferase